MLRKKLAIDLGTANTLVWVADPPAFTFRLSRPKRFAYAMRARLVLFITSDVIHTRLKELALAGSLEDSN